MNLIDEQKMEHLIKLQEGLQLKLYTDTRGFASIGYGRNLSTNGIRQSEANLMFANDLADIENELRLNIPWYTQLNDARQAIIISMAYNLGISGLMGFKDFLRAAEAGDTKNASQAILDSNAARELPNRYERLSYIWETGVL